MDTPLDTLTEQFRRLPGIGVKTARKLAYYIVQQSPDRVDEFIAAIRNAKENMHFCSICFNLSSKDPCPICSDDGRDHSIICVVETPQDVQAIERSGDYHGLYHVLHGALSPLDGIGVDDLRIKELLQRLGNTDVKEVIIATDPDVEGEATALYLARLLKTAGIRVTRIARGLPMGGDIEYADEATLAGAVANRQEM
ncbi:recombinase RecR [Megasphaera cerevisiae DSM 20462]|jgi:recombination protein RecR|uniref:Recombination protein RecR n=1 Tax=Megasphaera cerevisiae DSM 20462 TaxID=1122219 RepID=A0A0J6X0C4_9FIRM|nr:recombination mediator RecR [Megasphaera cerevisiae]KMO87597.1 recombinase RecR [Megasphaera cerevisiae DSM 20462]OKY54693.1 recombination protein RecR [Megasphaera cerevisiae]SJZ65850.1 DNA replication and repair protein RecR [Megasphaera cerevisiae DSM 20462]